MTRTFTTNLRCGACVSKIRPAFDAEPGIDRWQVDLASPDRTLTVEGAVTRDRVKTLLNQAGYLALSEAAPEPKTSYYPLALIIAYILGVTLLFELAAGNFDVMRFMRHFMAGLFLVFSFFKLLDVKGFADSFAMYDLLARRSRAYALAYPFLELALGVGYLVNASPMIVNAVTLAVMSISTAGVVGSIRSKLRIKCACLGTVFNLPMSYVTLFEDVTMAVMAAGMMV